MSERIEELRAEVARREQLMAGSGIQPYMPISTSTVTSLMDRIDALTRERDALRAACEKTVAYHDPNGREFIDHAAAIHEYVTLCRHALAANGE